MRKLIHLIIFFGLLASCGEENIVQYEYRSTTMMGKTVVTIRQDSVITTFNGRGTPTRTARATEASEWSALYQSLKGVELDKVASLEAPTDKRSTDAAPFGTLVVTTVDSVYTSATFDGKNPHEMLMPLMNEVIKIWEKQ
jgi:hypothetical protein